MNFQNLILELSEKNWCSQINALPDSLIHQLYQEALELDYRKAKIGSGSQNNLNLNIRSDSIHWLDEQTKSLSQAQNNFLEFAYEWMTIVNRELYLGLKEFECHFSHYQSGQFYQKHTDQFKGNNARTLTLIVYLNTPKEGGELVIYKKDDSNLIDQIIKPERNLMISFLSDSLYHEVLKAKDDRYAMTGWFKNKI